MAAGPGRSAGRRAPGPAAVRGGLVLYPAHGLKDDHQMKSKKAQVLLPMMSSQCRTDGPWSCLPGRVISTDGAAPHGPLTAAWALPWHGRAGLGWKACWRRESGRDVGMSRARTVGVSCGR